MTIDPSIREQTYAYFIQEAPQLLQILEQELLSLREDYSITKVHTLMRTTHTLKGAAASVGLESIKTVAHSLEDIFKTLFQPDLAIDREIEALLFEGYECLRAPLMAELTGSHGNNSEIFDRAAAIFTRLQEKLGDCFDQEAYIPTSAELGFDVTQSIFELGVTQRLEEIASVLASGQHQVVASTLEAQAEIFLGLAESLNLPGFGAIAQAAITALAKHPDQAVTIAQAALADFQQGQAAVLAGDRTSGGKPIALQELAGGEGELGAEATDSLLEVIWNISESEVPTDEPEFAHIPFVDSAPVPAITSEGEEALDSPKEPALWDKSEVAVEPELSLYQIQGSESTSMPKKDSVPVCTVRVNVEHLDRLNYFIGELLTNQNRQSLQDEQLQGRIQELLSQLAKHQQLLNQLRDWSDSLELDRQSELHFLVQSLLENAVQLEASTDTIDLFSRQSSQILEKQSRLLTSAQNDLLEARMVPLGNIFSLLPRVLQQLETLHNKSVALKLSGTEVLVDKAVAEKLYDPLLHLVRNAFDHGIEPIEVRQQRGKAEKGQIEIRAFHQGSHLMIQVLDDGQGLKFEQIRQRAVELNLVSPEQARNLNEAQMMDLLFESGFSTASQVNNLSGRGIGLDVVRAQLQSLQGSVTVYSEPNRGTAFLLQIPFSLTMAKLFLTQAGPTLYALLSDAIEQILVPESDQLRHWEGGKVLRCSKGADERLVPVFKLSEILNYFSPVTEPLADQAINPNSLAATEPVMGVFLLRCQDELLGLEVDQIMGEQELVIRPLGPMIVPPPYVYGGSILADGRLTLVIDGAALVKYVFERQNSNALRGLGQSVSTKGGIGLVSFTPPILSSNSQHNTSSDASFPAERAFSMPAATLLLVDDSLTLRQTLALTLQKYGYQVLQVRDGYEAIEQLRLQPDIRLVICDIEMPRMNGFEFLKYRGQDPALAEIPVIILTSRSGEKHRLIAIELGATAYMTKPYLEQQLLATVAGLLQKNRLNFVSS